jgi:ribosomal protein S27AE
MNPGIEAVRMLAKIGYRFTVNGGIIRAKYEGQDPLDDAEVRPLFSVVKEHKSVVVFFLKSFCPRCGGVCFIDALCLACDWQQLVEIYPDLKVSN